MANSEGRSEDKRSSYVGIDRNDGAFRVFIFCIFFENAMSGRGKSPSHKGWQD
jgi:hypothetical protein